MRRLWFRRWLIFAGCGLLVALTWFFFFPVPLGWAVRFAAKHALPAEARLAVQFESATLRWRWSEPALRLVIRGAAVEAAGRPLATVAVLNVDIDKKGLGGAHLTPTFVELLEPRLSVDLAALLAPAGAAAPARPARTSGRGSVLAPFLAFLPTETRPARIRISGLQLALRNTAGRADWKFATIETSATRRGSRVRLDLSAAMAGPAPAPRVALEAEMALDAPTVAFAIRVPAFSTVHLPAWPGAETLPLQATIALDVRGEADAVAGRVLSVSGGVSLTDGLLTIPGLAAPIDIPRVELRARAAGSPLAFALEAGHIEIAGARVEVEKLSGMLGAQPRLAWQIACSDLRAAEWAALVPREVSARLPFPAEALATLILARATAAGDAQLVAAPEARWRLGELGATGELHLRNEGHPLTLDWQARQQAGGPVEITVAMPEWVPAQWGGRLAAGTLLAALALPVSARLEVTIDPAGEVQAAGIRLRAGPGTVAPWGPWPRPVTVRQLHAEIALADAGRRFRVPSLRVELDGPAVVLRDVEVALPPAAPASLSGELTVENLTDAWCEPWLPQGAFAPLDDLGLRRGDLVLSLLSARFSGQFASGAGGEWQPRAGEVSLAANASVQAMPLEWTGQAALNAEADGIDATLAIAELRPARLQLKRPAGLPPWAAFDFPVGLQTSVSAGLDGTLRGAKVKLNAGPGALRAAAPLGVEVPLKNFSVEAEAPGDFSRFRVVALDAEVGAGLRIRGKEMVWHAETTPRIAGELTIDACELRPLLPLLPAAAQGVARETLQAGAFSGAHLSLAATAAEKAPGGWRIDRLRGEIALGGLRAALPGAGTAALGQLALTLDYPRLALRLREVGVPAWFRGPMDLAMTIDAADWAALRAEISLDATRARLLPPAWAQIAIATAPLELAVKLGGGGGGSEAHFALDAPAVLGHPLRLAGQIKRHADGRGEAELAQLSFGRTAFTAKLRQASADRLAIALTGSRIDVDELLRAAAPFLGGANPSGPTKSMAVVAAAGAVPAGPPLQIDFEADVAGIDFGAARALRGLRAAGRLVDGWPEHARVEATEGAANTLRAELSGAGKKQRVHLAIADASAWVATLTHPLRATPLPAGELATLAHQLAQLPAKVAGGSIELEGELTERLRFTGRFQLGRATVVRPPRILQMLALKSGRTWGAQPLLENFSVERISADPEGITLDGLTIVGTGLVNRLKVRSARYRLADTKLAVDGEYFGVGFEVTGTRGDPQVFLKDSSALLRAIGQRNEFDFEAMGEDAKAGATPAR